MARTTLGTDLKVVKLVSGTAVETAGYGIVTIVLDVTTAGGGISAVTSSRDGTTYTADFLIDNTGAEVAAVTSSTVGQTVCHVAGGPTNYKFTIANATAYAVLSEPVRQA